MIKEGSVVVVTGKLDQRVRETTEATIYGTVLLIKNGKVWVLLKDANVWVGNDWEVYECQEGEHAG